MEIVLEVGLDGVAAGGALAVLHELALLERDLQLLLVAIQLQKPAGTVFLFCYTMSPCHRMR